MRRLIWSRLAAEAENLSMSDDAVNDLPEHLQTETNIRRLDLALSQVAKTCLLKSKGKAR